MANINLSPEGLTVVQEELAGLLFDTKIEAPVTRRITLGDGTFRFEKKIRPTSPVDFAQENEFALKLHEKDPGAPLSPFYLNLRNLPEELLGLVGLVLSEIPTDEKPDVVAGIPTAGVPLARAYGKFSGISVVEIFNKEQTEKGRRIVGSADADSSHKRLRIIDDLVTKGDTKLESLRAAEEMGFEILDLVVLVDRQQGAIGQLQEFGYTLRPAFKVDQLLRYGLRTERISNQQYEQVAEYLGLR